MPEASLKLHPCKTLRDGSSVERDNMDSITLASAVDCTGDADEGNNGVD